MNNSSSPSSDTADRVVNRTLVMLTLLLLALIGAAGWVLFQNEKAKEKQAAENELATIADLKVKQIVWWMSERRGDAKAALQEFEARQVLANPASNVARNTLFQWMATVARVYDYRGVALFDSVGVLQLAAPTNQIPPNTNVAAEIQAGLHARDVIVTDLHRDVPGGVIHLNMIVPVGLKPKAGQLADGVLLFDIDPNRFLYPVLQSWPVPSRTAETVLVRHEGNDVLFLNELRHSTNTALILRRPLNPKSRLPAALAAMGQEGLAEGLDYRDIPVLAALRKIPDTPWFIVVKKDRAEIFAPLRRDAWMVAALAGVLMLAVLLGISLARRQMKLMLARQETVELKSRQREIERLSRLYATLSQVNQAIVRVQSREKLFGEVCRVAIEFGHLKLAWIGEQNPQTQQIVPVAFAGPSADYVKSLKVFGDDRPEGRGPAGTAFRENRVAVFNDMLHDPRAAPWQDAMRANGLASCACVPVHFCGTPWGVFALYAGEEDFFHDREVELLAEMGLDISFALDHLATLAESRDSQSLYHSLVEQMPVGVFRKNAEGRYVFVNSWFCRLKGVRPELYLGKMPMEVVAAELAAQGPNVAQVNQLGARAVDHHRRIMETGRTIEVEERGIGPDGQDQVLHVVKSAIFDQDGKITGSQGIMFDITERRRMEEKLQIERTLLQTVVDNLPDAIYAKDAATRKTLVNPADLRNLGAASPAEALGKTDFDFFPREQAEHFHADDQRVLKTGEAVLNREEMFTRPDGTAAWLMTSKVPLRDATGRVTGLVGIGRDITEQKRAEETLRESEEKFAAAFRASPNLIAITRMTDGIIMEVNEGFSRVLGYSRGEAVGKTTLDLSIWEDPADRATFIAHLKESGQITDFETKLRRKDGVVITVLDSARIVKLQGETCILSVIYDITERKQMEEVLRESEKKFRQLFDGAADAICVHDADGRIRDVNPAFCHLLGYSREELVGMSVSGIEAEYRAADLAQLWQQVRQGKTVIAEGLRRRRDGSTFPDEVHLTLLTDDNVPLFYAAVRDITERRQAEEARERLAAIVNSSNDAIISKTLDGNITSWNHGAEKVFGYSAAEAAGQPVLMLFPPERISEEKEFLERIRRGESVERYESVRVCKDGRRIDVSITLSPITDSDGKIIGASKIVRDITERKRAEQKIREQARLIDEAHDAIILNDLAGVIQMWNRGAETIFGWQEPVARGRVLMSFLKEDLFEYQTALHELLQHDRWAGELSAQAKDGRNIIVDSHWTLLRDPEGKPQKVLIICHDVTAHKQMESQLLRAQRQQTLGTLSSGIAHDLNNILSPFLIGLPLLREEIKNKDTQHLVTMMETSVLRGADLVRQVLLFGRGGESQRIPFNLDRSIREVTKIINETFPKNLALKTSWPENLWSVSANPTQIYQVLLNLCVNARDAMPAGGALTITVDNVELADSGKTLHPRAKPGPYVVLSVCDTGIGMAPEVVDRIFEPFFTTKEIGKGTGLGLSVVIGVVENHDGFINVQSKVGAGTEFRVYLPALPDPGDSQETGSATELAQGHGELILVVDDEHAICKVLGKTLERNGYKVVTANGGAEALKIHAEKARDIKAVISDYAMPGMDGFALAAALRKNQPDVNIIIASGLGQTLDAARFETVGVKRILKKPFTAQSVLQALREILAEPVGS